MSDTTTDQRPDPMDCERVMRDDISERYVSGRLDDVERRAFEDHYFDCARCSEELQTYLALQDEVGRLGAAAPGPAARPPAAFVRWAGFAAAALLVVAVAFWLQRPGAEGPPPPAATSAAAPPTQVAPPATPEAAPRPAFTLAELADVSPPAYVPAAVRSTTSRAMQRFRQAMELYQRGDFAAAVSGLEEARRTDGGQPPILFYLGACYLLTNDVDRAVEALTAAVASGESAYLEEAHFYLAKALLRKGDGPGARAELEATAALEGDREAEARELLRRMQQVR